ncbi:glycoside hydrolase family 18 protein [Ginsengibacter hankyongi]|uniref:chitinase n=1 Tax=Ginsengibacter hankyongi TaxID=2607284 RepID=A0A5J5IEP7_9BACT|nr:glycoside hydrolase family 18 protein [Ginsengibacter hankyongi]KAA9037570.1 glycoside hydrolase family 18 protein [Ginsengibacter hankyongi]
MMRITSILATFTFITSFCNAQNNKEQNNIAVIGYYAGRTTAIDSFEIEKLTHLIFSFCHLKGDSLAVDNARDSATIVSMVALKQRNPRLKILLSLGGWGGCKTCSAVFSTKKGRKTFSNSVKHLTDYFGTDGIDLDWEYPAISGFPGHAYGPEDKPNFTALVKELRKKLGKKKEISFAAGGFSSYIDSAVEWKKVMPMINRINLMSYDLVSGFSKVSGHHTPLYSTAQQVESVDNGVKELIAAGVPPAKIAIGAAFYARLFEVSDTANNGLYRPGHFYHGLSYSRFADTININNGFIQYWDSTAMAPYAFNKQRKLLATYDDSVSIKLKTEYVIKNKLNGIMFWQLADDSFTNGLLDAIDKAKKQETK